MKINIFETCKINECLDGNQLENSLGILTTGWGAGVPSNIGTCASVKLDHATPNVFGKKINLDVPGS